jgi:hypothetical protein
MWRERPEESGIGPSSVFRRQWEDRLMKVKLFLNFLCLIELRQSQRLNLSNDRLD